MGSSRSPFLKLLQDKILPRSKQHEKTTVDDQEWRHFKPKKIQSGHTKESLALKHSQHCCESLSHYCRSSHGSNYLNRGSVSPSISEGQK